MLNDAEVKHLSSKKDLPDYKKQLIDEKVELDVVKNFKESLIPFIKVMGLFYFEENSPLALLLGQVEINILEREETLADIQKLIDETN